MNRIVRNPETFFTTMWSQNIYKDVIIKSLRSHINIKFFFMQSSNVRVSHKRMVHAGKICDAFDISNWPGCHL